MKRLIVNADDLGMCDAVDEGIIKAHREGIVSSATLLACGESAAHAAALALENPGLGVGVHLCLTRLKPLSGPAQIPTIAKRGVLPSGPLRLMAGLIYGSVDRADIAVELRAQIQKAIELGIRPTHLDGHQHMHVMPGIFPVVARLAKEFDIPVIRFPVGPWLGVKGAFSNVEKFMLELLANTQETRINGYGFRRPDRFYGLGLTGRLDAASVLGIIRRLPDGTSELMCHPGLRDDEAAKRLGWGDGWEAELAAVSDPRLKDALSDAGVELSGYNCL
jgi:predicted glycoside hydrolase/deacetylase ChbG (UPF0249 family)